MSRNSFGFLNSPSPLGPACLDGQNIDTSTPLTTNAQDEVNLHSDIEETLTPTNLRKRHVHNGSLHSILKNSPNKTLAQANTSYYTTNLDSLSANHDTSGQAPCGHARVLFSPTKEVVSYVADYHKEFTVDLTKLDDEVGESGPRTTKPKAKLLRKQLWTDPRVPHVLLLYLQLVCNMILVMVVMYIVYVMITNIRADVRHKIEMYTSDAMHEISRCSRDYYRNKCSNDESNVRAPALEKVCTAWEKCMNRDPQQIGRSKITAETFAEIVNAFFKPITWKSLLMFTFLLVGSFVVTNVTFGTYRRATHMQDSGRLELLERKLADQQQQLEQRQQHVLPATPPSQFIGTNYDPILNDSMISCIQPRTNPGNN